MLLVGFMGAGKTEVGVRVARALGWTFADFDDEIEARAGRSVPEIFQEIGEAGFRQLETAVGVDLLSRSGVVLAAGGGWAAVPGRLASAPEGTATVWLRVSAEEAVRRASSQPGRRPLLEVDDPVGRAAALSAARESAYAAARWAVDTEGRTVDDVSARILEILAAEYPDT